jgi:hypothetical protein
MDIADKAAISGAGIVDRIINESAVLATCKKCGVLSIVDSNLNIKRFSPL